MDLLFAIGLFTLYLEINDAATQLYGLQWKWFAYTTGNDDGMKYVDGDSYEIYTISSAITSLRFKNAKSGTYGFPKIIEIYNNDGCWEGTSFNIDTMLKCKGRGSNGYGWAGLGYKSGNDGPNESYWDHSEADYWIMPISATKEALPYIAPLPSSQYIPILRWFQWAYTDGNDNFFYNYGSTTLYTFESAATQMIFRNDDGDEYIMNDDDYCWPTQNFNIDDTLRCTGVNVNYRGWAGIFYKKGESQDARDWSYWKARFYVFITAPTQPPTNSPTEQPTKEPTQSTNNPTAVPSLFPTKMPTESPTDESFSPTLDPTMEPTLASINPTQNPTMEPTVNPTLDPTLNTYSPTINPTYFPSSNPTVNPTYFPSNNPTINPTINPTYFPSNDPTINPTVDPSFNPTLQQTGNPTPGQSGDPTLLPSTNPTVNPRKRSTFRPANDPTSHPTFVPSVNPTLSSILNPTTRSTFSPTKDPTVNPTFVPSDDPTVNPTLYPTFVPSSYPNFAGSLKCGESLTGMYNDTIDLQFLVTAFESDVKFDASLSTFDMLAIEAYNFLSDELIASDDDKDGVLTLESYPPVIYRFSIKAKNATKGGTFHVQIDCVSHNPHSSTQFPSRQPILPAEAVENAKQTNTNFKSTIFIISLPFLTILSISGVFIVFYCWNLQSTKQKWMTLNENENENETMPQTNIQMCTSVSEIMEKYGDKSDDKKQEMIHSSVENERERLETEDLYGDDGQMDDEKGSVKLLKRWELGEYAKVLIEDEGYDDVEDWKAIKLEDLIEMGFKKGHAAKFVRKLMDHLNGKEGDLDENDGTNTGGNNFW